MIRKILLAAALATSTGATAFAEIDARAEEMYEMGVSCESDLHQQPTPHAGSARHTALMACKSICYSGFDTVDHDTPLNTIDALADACEAAHDAVPAVDPLAAIALPLAYRSAILAKCEANDPDVSAIFLSELASIDADAAMALSLNAATIKAEAMADEAEYICTGEMFESSQVAAEAALKAWTAYQGK